MSALPPASDPNRPHLRPLPALTDAQRHRSRYETIEAQAALEAAVDTAALTVARTFRVTGLEQPDVPACGLTGCTIKRPHRHAGIRKPGLPVGFTPCDADPAATLAAPPPSTVTAANGDAPSTPPRPAPEATS